MFTLQLHIPLNSPLGQRIPLVQHLIATAAVMGIKNLPGYEVSETRTTFLFILTNILFLDRPLIHHIIFFLHFLIGFFYHLNFIFICINIP